MVELMLRLAPQEGYTQALHDGVIDDFQRIWQGQGMPPLGEGAVCDYCEARGLCRKDHWVSGGQA